MKGPLALVVVALAGGLLYFASADEERVSLSFAIFERAATDRDRAPQIESAATLRTQQQTGELRFAGEFRGRRIYLGRDDTGACLFEVHRDTTGTSCGPSSLAFKTIQVEERGEKVAFLVVPDGMEWRVYIGRAKETQELENVVALAFDGPITVRIEGAGRQRDVQFR